MTVTATTELALRTQIVLDTSALVADPTVMYAYPSSDVVIPITVIEELDGFKRYEDDRGRSAREALRTIERIRAGGDPTVPIDLPDGGTLRIELNGIHTEHLARHGLNPSVADNRIIAAALGQQDRRRDAKVVVVSNDAGLRIKAASLGLDAKEQSAGRGPDQQRRGWDTIEAGGALSNMLHEGRLIPNDVLAAHGLDKIPLNEFVAMKSGGLARRHPDGLRMVAGKSGWDLKPRGAEQAFALDLLLDPDIPDRGADRSGWDGEDHPGPGLGP